MIDLNLILKDVRFIYPELTITVTIIVVILADLVLASNKKSICSWLTVGGSVIALLLSLQLYSSGDRLLFSNLLALDPFALFFKVFSVASLIFTVLFSVRSNEIDKRYQSEYYVFLLSSVLGMFLLSAATDMLMIYISLELVSISSYILAGHIKDSQRSSEAALKYVIYGAFSSGSMIYGMSLIYGLTGATNLYHINEVLTIGVSDRLTLLVSAILILVGLGYKIASVPFHFWCPDVYEGAPTPITAFLSVAPKAAGFAVLIRFFYGAFSTPSFTFEWVALLTIICVLTMTLGNLSAIPQNNLKRLLAYSGIAHAGYMLMGVVVLTSKGLKAVLFYLAVYLFMNLGAFLVVLTVADKLGSEDIKDYKGLGWRSPFVAFVMAVFLFSLTGIPPTAGFVGKWYLFAALVDGRYYWLAVVGVLNSVISLYYYTRIIRTMFLEVPSDETKPSFSPIHIVLLAILVVPTMLLGIYWSPLVRFTDNSIRFFFGG